MQTTTTATASALRRRMAAFPVYICLFVLIAYAIFPFLWILSTSLKPTPEIRTAHPSFIPTHIDWSHYALVLEHSNFLRYVRNSLLVSSAVTLTTLIVATMAAYSFSRFRQLPGISIAGVGLLIGQLVPSVLLIVPLYITMNNLHLLNSFWSLIITYTTFTVPLSALMLKGFFDHVPVEIEDAAQIDGCPAWQVVWRVVLPLSLPGLMTTALYAFVQSWNEFLFSYTFISADSRRTLTPGMADFIGMWTVDWGALMAAAVLGVLPVTLAYLYLQRYLIAGLTTGATKG
jgi:multiple sugar transport system permease protein/raffinose/stachyose/melibiose transport system permease protein